MVYLTGGFDLSILDRLLPPQNETVAERPFKKLKVTTKKPSKNSSDHGETSYTFFEVLTDEKDNKTVGIDSSNVKPKNKKKVKQRKKDKPTRQSSTQSRLKKQKNATEKKVSAYNEKKVTVAKKVLEKIPSSEGMYVVQAGSFKNMKSADSLVSKLKSKGYSAYWREKEVGKEKEKWFRVYLGSFSTHEDALAMVQKGRLKEKLDPMIIFQRN